MRRNNALVASIMSRKMLNLSFVKVQVYAQVGSDSSESKLDRKSGAGRSVAVVRTCRINTCLMHFHKVSLRSWGLDTSYSMTQSLSLYYDVTCSLFSIFYFNESGGIVVYCRNP